MRKFAPLALLALSAPVFAQDAAFTTAVTGITADVTSYGGTLVGVAAISVVFMIAIKYVKKIRGAA
jgi:hypothetical protein